MYPSLWLTAYRTNYLSIYLSIDLSVDLPTYLSIYLSIYIYLSIHLSMYLSICPSCGFRTPLTVPVSFQSKMSTANRRARLPRWQHGSRGVVLRRVRATQGDCWGPMTNGNNHHGRWEGPRCQSKQSAAFPAAGVVIRVGIVQSYPGVLSLCTVVGFIGVYGVSVPRVSIGIYIVIGGVFVQFVRR